ncbi:hypothetical protein PHET_03018 [Paragonimus heterotremus]|uniref:Uncharacterized protein n=1 Tax=Paragonimus heterotremus TaxID=100268 RepID=A0A8J4WTF1_9TREM|nr:hypothetical protein PHET_03018 [Paragonimus heterotremus]
MLPHKGEFQNARILVWLGTTSGGIAFVIGLLRIRVQPISNSRQCRTAQFFNLIISFHQPIRQLCSCFFSCQSAQFCGNLGRFSPTHGPTVSAANSRRLGWKSPKSDGHREIRRRPTNQTSRQQQQCCLCQPQTRQSTLGARMGLLVLRWGCALFIFVQSDLFNEEGLRAKSYRPR